MMRSRGSGLPTEVLRAPDCFQYTASHIYPKKKSGSCTFSIEKLPIFVKICEKETVDQGGLSQARLPFRCRIAKRKQVRYSTLLIVDSSKLCANQDLPATIRVKSNPFLTDLRCTWLGRVANPTYSLSWSCKMHTDMTMWRF